ncbi:MAG: alpha/beta fold hydrolase [Pararhodobacter sp.]
MSAPYTVRMGRPGGLPTVMAHCFLGHSGGWAGLVQALDQAIAPGLDALAFDMPGHGRSDPWADATGQGDYQADVTAILAGLVRHPSLLVGHSFGATVALRHALQRPDMVRGLVLFEPVFFAAAADEPEFQDHLRDEVDFSESLQRGDLESAARHFMQINGDAPAWESLPEKQRSRFMAQMPLIAASRPGVFDDSGAQLAPGRMEGFACPVLLITGAQSPGIFQAVSRALAARLGRAETACIQGAGHMVPITHAAECAGLIGTWMQRHGLDRQPDAAPDQMSLMPVSHPATG